MLLSLYLRTKLEQRNSYKHTQAHIHTLLACFEKLIERVNYQKHLSEFRTVYSMTMWFFFPFLAFITFVISYQKHTAANRSLKQIRAHGRGKNRP